MDVHMSYSITFYAWNIESTNEDGTSYAIENFPQVAPKPIGPGQFLSLNLTPLIGLLNINKYLPLKFLGGMQLEFTLANANEALNPMSASRSFQIEQPQMRFSVIFTRLSAEQQFFPAVVAGKSVAISSEDDTHSGPGPRARRV
jgi:hypothetical protein